MASVNKVILVGHLGSDPTLRQVGNSQVASMTVATSETWNDANGLRQERTEWHNVSAWGKLAEICAQHLAKGRQVYVEGRIQSREYQDKEGQQRKVVEIKADQVVFLGPAPGGSGSSFGGSQKPSQSKASKPASNGWGTNKPAVDDDNDPIPF